jgi:hypothetical protein
VNQEVALRATEGGERVEATCVVFNDQASWSVVAPATFGVTRSDKPLRVECRNPEGRTGARTFEPVREGGSVGAMTGGLSGGLGGGYGYPATLEVALARQDPTGASPPRGPSRTVETSPVAATEARAYAPLFDVDRLPAMGEDGREGYRRFLAGEAPRAFAVSDQGHWVRANGVNGAPRLALDRCQSYGGRCRLYAVDDQVVWDPARPGGSDATY